MIIEKRYYPRIDSAIEAEIRHRGRSFSGRVNNLSAGGLFIETGYVSIPRGNMITIRFRLHDQEWVLSGLIVGQTNEGGLCIMFQEPQPALLEQISKTASRMTRLPYPRTQGGVDSLDSTV